MTARHHTTRSGQTLSRLAIATLALLRPGMAIAAPGLSVRFGTCPTGVALISDGAPARVIRDATADAALGYAASNFAQDLGRVGGTDAPLSTDPHRGRGPAVIIGVVGHSALLDRMVRAGVIDLTGLAGQWEGYRQFIVHRPLPGIDRALVIAGADRRGAVFGTYDISEKIGVSPDYWFADVPVAHHGSVCIAGTRAQDAPKVRYRGFFINDEDPALKGWAQHAFGGVNAAMYAHVFEYLLRMKGNTLWPAMWGKAFALDDPRSQPLADAMGVVMGTSHHEPMMRAQQEWHTPGVPGAGGAWDYARNGENLRRFWRDGIARMTSKGPGQAYDSLVTIGMRGDGDEPLSEGTAIAQLQTIVADQRRIIADVTGKPAARTPQVWALYKEVQDYYDHGMRVPDDVTLLFSDDNWGQIRRLPPADAPPRAGGYGIYYHFDYVGVPRNYKWINTNQIEKIWQQMDLAWQRSARQLWIANVGDIKPMEYPLAFWMKEAWNPAAMTAQALAAYPTTWAAQRFGSDHAAAIGDILSRYSQYTARRKPELIDQDSFAIGQGVGPILDGGAFGQMVAQWNALEAQMIAVRDTLPANQRDAYFQLVEYPVAAMANLYRMYDAAAWNRRLIGRVDARANPFADQVEADFARDAELVERYHTLHGGKWNGMMSQVHMNYVSWNDPVRQSAPSVSRIGMTAGPVVFAPPAPPSPGAIAILATRYSHAENGHGLTWAAIDHLGRTGGAMLALPQGRAATTPADGVRLDYDVTLATSGDATLTLMLAPTLNTGGGEGLRIGVSIDDGAVQVLTAALEPTGNDPATPGQQAWATAVTDDVVRLTARLGSIAPGPHRIRVWRIDDNVVLEKLVLATAAVPASDLGPPAPGE